MKTGSLFPVERLLSANGTDFTQDAQRQKCRYRRQQDVSQVARPPTSHLPSLRVCKIGPVTPTYRAVGPDGHVEQSRCSVHASMMLTVVHSPGTRAVLILLSARIPHIALQEGGSMVASACIPLGTGNLLLSRWIALLEVEPLWRSDLLWVGGANGKEPNCQCRRHKRRRFDPWVRKIP